MLTRPSVPIFFLLCCQLLSIAPSIAGDDHLLVDKNGDSKFVRRALVETVGVGERCNENSRPCAAGLSCIRTPFLGLVNPSHICVPLECLEAAATSLENIFNVSAYQEQIFDIAGVSPEEFFVQGQSRFSVYSVPGEMQDSPAFQKVIQTIVDNPVPKDSWANYHSALAACDPELKLSNGRPNPGSGPTVGGVTGTIGFRFDVGAVVGGGVELFWLLEGDEPIFFVKVGGGLFAGADIAIAPALGVVFTGNSSDLPGVNFQVDVRAPAPIIHAGASVTAYTLAPVWGLNFLLGVSAGIHVLGLYYGHTWGFYGNGTALCPNC